MSLQNYKAMSVEIITKEDLKLFRIQLLDELKQFIRQPQPQAPKEWLRSHEVKKLLNISSGTLHNFRSNGALPSKKVGGTIFYRYADIANIINGSQ